MYNYILYHENSHLVIHLNQLKSKNLTLKDNAKNLLSSIKILLFRPEVNDEDYFELIRAKFIKYFYINFFSFFPLNKMIWLYGQYNLLLYEDIDLLFFTNNIAESYNRMLNNLYIGNIKSFHNFKNSFNDFVEIYSKSKRKYISNCIFCYTSIRRSYKN